MGKVYIRKINPEVPELTMDEARQEAREFILPIGEGKLFFPPRDEDSRYQEFCYTKQVVSKIIELMKSGASKKDAASYVGIPLSTVNWWAKHNHGNFAIAVENAEAHAKVHNILKIQSGGKGWQASAWLLERKHKEEYAKDMNNQVSMKDAMKLVQQVVAIVSNRLSNTNPEIVEQIAYDIQNSGLLDQIDDSQHQ